jgi:hypothetical protein
MADNSKFKADPARIIGVQDGMAALAEMADGIINAFQEHLKGAPEVLGFDETGMQANLQLKQLTDQVTQGVASLAKVLRAVPEAFTGQGMTIDKTHRGVSEAIHTSAGKQGQIAPVPDGFSGKY